MADENIVSVRYNVDVSQAMSKATDFQKILVNSLNAITERLAAINQSSQSSAQAFTDFSNKTANAINQMSSNLSGSLEKIIQKLEQLSSATGKVSNSISNFSNQTNNYSRSYSNSVNQMAIITDNSTRTIVNNFTQINNAIRETATEAGRARSPVGDMIKALIGFNAISRVTGMVYNFGKQIFNSAREMEMLHARLNNIMGSAEKGAQAFDFITKKGTQTAQTIDQITNAFIVMQNSGMNPMGTNMQSLIDTMAKYNNKADALARVTKDISHAYMMGHIQQRTMTTLHNNGIPALEALEAVTGKNKEQLEKMYRTHELGKDVLDKFIAQLGKMSEGAAIAQMDTLSGIISNLHDKFLVLSDELNKVDAFYNMKKGIVELLDQLDVLKENGSIKDFGIAVNYAIGAAINAFKAFYALLNDILTPIGEIFDSMAGQSLKFSDYIGIAFAAANIAVQTAVGLMRSIVVSFVEVIKITYVNIADNLHRSKNEFTAFKEGLSAIIYYLVAAIVSFGRAVDKVLHFDFSGAISEWEFYKNSVVQKLKETQQKLKELDADNVKSANDAENKKTEIVRQATDKQKKIIEDYKKGLQVGSAPAKDSKAGKEIKARDDEESSSTKKEKGAASELQKLMARWEAEKLIIEQRYETKKMFYDKEKQLEDEIAFLSANSGSLKTERERVSLKRKIDQDKIQLGQLRLNAEVKQLREELEEKKGNYEEQLRIEDQILAHYRKGSGEYNDELKKRLKMVENHKKDMAEIKRDELQAETESNLDLLDEQISSTKEQLINYEITHDEYIKKMREFIAEKYRLKRLEFQADLDSDDPKVKSKAELGIKKLDRQEGKENRGINVDVAKNSVKVWDDAFKQLENSSSSHFEKMLAGQERFSKAMKGIAADMAKFAIKEGEKELFTFLRNQAKKLLTHSSGEAQMNGITATGQGARLGLMQAGQAREMGIKLPSLGFHQALETSKTVATEAGEAERTAATEAGEGESLIIKAAGAIKSIAMDAWQAMAGAYAAISSIPVVGPVLAPAAAAAAFAGVVAIGKNIASASGGYDIPAGVNPLTQLHEQEMVLPKEHANTIRNLKEGGGSGGNTINQNNKFIFPNGNADSFRKSKTQLERYNNRIMKPNLI